LSVSRVTAQLFAFAGRQLLQPRAVDLNAFVTALHPDRAAILGSRIGVQTTLAPHLRSAYVDEARLRQAISGLAVRAREAMPDGGSWTLATAHVDVAATPTGLPLSPGAYVSLSLMDSGTPLAADLLAHLFDPFHGREEPLDDAGLLLPSVHGLMKQSGGHVAVRSDQTGTAFTLLLPVAGPGPLPPTQPAVVAELACRAPGTVLLVDDNDAVRGFAARALGSRGWRVLSAKTPAAHCGSRPTKPRRSMSWSPT
jgi:two-component system, chemotaxis family, CheB/CheR fusion protein